MMQVRGYLRPLSMFDTCVGLYNDDSIDMCLDGRLYHLSFDWKTKALVSNERHFCSAFHDTTLAKACRLACKQHVTDKV